MKHNSVYWSTAIVNVAIMICWTALAIHFDKWWIALFAVICLRDISWKRA